MLGPTGPRIRPGFASPLVAPLDVAQISTHKPVTTFFTSWLSRLPLRAMSHSFQLPAPQLANTRCTGNAPWTSRSGQSTPARGNPQWRDGWSLPALPSLWPQGPLHPSSIPTSADQVRTQKTIHCPSQHSLSPRTKRGQQRRTGQHTPEWQCNSLPHLKGGNLY